MALSKIINNKEYIFASSFNSKKEAVNKLQAIKKQYAIDTEITESNDIYSVYVCETELSKISKQAGHRYSYIDI